MAYKPTYKKWLWIGMVAADVEDEGGMTEIDINDRKYTYRLRFDYTYYYGDGELEAELTSIPTNKVERTSKFFISNTSFRVKMRNLARGTLIRAADCNLALLAFTWRSGFAGNIRQGCSICVSR
ncbi:MAG: hypothetical protein PHF24_05250 [Syntrophomonas sp.]|nr:hypothetical protein [Syntrophomonas sp.]